MQAIASFKRPEKPVVIYEFDACPFCKKVREMVCYLDLDVLFYPCPQGGPNFRPEAIAKGGKSRFPYMEDPNTGAAMYESDDIIKYLADTYGDGTVPLALRLGAATAITAGLSGIGRCALTAQCLLDLWYPQSDVPSSDSPVVYQLASTPPPWKAYAPALTAPAARPYCVRNACSSCMALWHIHSGTDVHGSVTCGMPVRHCVG